MSLVNLAGTAYGQQRFAERPPVVRRETKRPEENFSPGRLTSVLGPQRMLWSLYESLRHDARYSIMGDHSPATEPVAVPDSPSPVLTTSPNLARGSPMLGTSR